MKKVIMNIYDFNELEKDVKRKLLNEEIENQKEIYCECMLENDMQEKGEELLKKYFNIDNGLNKVYYDLSYCQGSGCMVAFSTNINELNKKYHIFSDKELKVVNEYFELSDIDVISGNNHYTHEFSFKINYNYDYGCDSKKYNISNRGLKDIEDKIVNFLATFKIQYNTNSQFVNDIISMNKELTRYGYDLLENDNYYKEGALMYLEDKQFYKNGEIFEEM